METIIRNSKENIATDVIYISHNAVNVTEKTIYSNSYSYIDNSYMDKISLNLENGFNTIIVIDIENMNMNNENIEELTFSGRHYNCTIIFLTVSDWTSFLPLIVVALSIALLNICNSLSSNVSKSNDISNRDLSFGFLVKYLVINF